MKVDVVFLKNFLHGSIRGVAGKSGSIPEPDARALAKAGLVRLVAEAPTAKKLTPAGSVPPLSALPAAPALPATTSIVSTDGETPNPKRRHRRKSAASL